MNVFFVFLLEMKAISNIIARVVQDLQDVILANVGDRCSTRHVFCCEMRFCQGMS